MISLLKSEKGSLGFTLTKGNDQGCYIHDIVQDPAKADGRLRPGDRMIKVWIHSNVFIFFLSVHLNNKKNTLNLISN